MRTSHAGSALPAASQAHDVKAVLAEIDSIDDCSKRLVAHDGSPFGSNQSRSDYRDFGGAGAGHLINGDARRQARGCRSPAFCSSR